MKRLATLSLILLFASSVWAGTGVDDSIKGTRVIPAGSGTGTSATAGGADTQVQYNDGGAINGDAGMTYNDATNTLTVDSIVTTGNSSIDAGTGGLDFVDSNTIFVGINDDIATVAAAATAGDTLILAAGTYTITADIDITKALTIIGQGPSMTTIATSTATLNLFDVSASNVRISNLSISSTGAGTSRGIRFDGTAGTVISNDNVDNVVISMSGTGAQRCILYNGASGRLVNVIGTATSSNNDATGVYVLTQVTEEAAITVNVFGGFMTTSAGGGTLSHAYYVSDSGSSNNATLNLYRTQALAIETGGTPASRAAVADSDGGANAILNVYGGHFNGTDADVSNFNNTAQVYTYGPVLQNNLWASTVTVSGIIVAYQNLVVPSQGVQTIAGGDTILANACGGFKRINSGGAVTTNTTNTFTAPALNNAGCMMQVCNVGASNITLDNNSNFKSKSASDVVLTADDCIIVNSTGSSGVWYQITDIEAN